MHANELHDLRRAFEAAREFTLPVGPEDAKRTVTLRTPTEHQLKLCALRAGVSGPAQDLASMAVLERSLLELCIVGWAAFSQADVVAGGSADPLPFDAAATGLLLDAQPAWFAPAGAELFTRLAQRGSEREEAAKNS